MSRTPFVLSALLALSACASPQTARPRARARHHRPRVVVTVVIDQFAAWVAEERLPELPPDGGFARLRREGSWVRHARFDHSATDTAPGHASLYTAVPPRESGIFGNEIIGADGEKVSILRDVNSRVVGASGPTDRVGSSIVRLRVPTLADRLRERSPSAVVVSLSLKDRGAIFGGGRTPDAVLWFDTALDRFVTSTAFAHTLPEWSLALGSSEALRARRATPWTLLDEPWVRAHAATPDAQPGEGDLGGFGSVFPHDFSRAATPPAAMRASPVGDDALIDLALSAVEHARRPDAPMLLALSLSSNDYIGHVFGPDSWEAWDELRRLDANLARLFRGLDAAAGADGWAVVLSADHGTITMPEAGEIPAARGWCHRIPTTEDSYARPCGALSRVIPEDWARELQTAANQALSPGSWVLGIADPYVFLSPAAHALPPERRGVLFNALSTALRTHSEVLDVIDPKEQAAVCPPPADASLGALVCRSIPRAIDGDLYILTRPGVFFDPGYTPGYGTSHGSPYLYDRTVPVLARAPGAIAAGRTLDAPMSFTVFADTAAALLDLPNNTARQSALVGAR